MVKTTSGPQPLFLTALARGGSNLLARMLQASGACSIAIHGCQPYFKSLRNAVVRERASPGLRDWFDLTAPFHDGFFDHRQGELLALLHDATLDLPFAGSEWPTLLGQLRARAEADAADLGATFSDLSQRDSYRGLLDDIFALIVKVRRAESCRWSGLIETWTIDFLPALARAYPSARFIVALRDPRAVVASALGYLPVDPGQVGHVLSIARQWRKYAALGYIFANKPLFAGRLKLVRYEDQLQNPERFANELCGFLDMPYHAAMVDFSQYRDATTGRQWQGNSTFSPMFASLDLAAAFRWRTKLSPAALALVEFACGRDMAAFGYSLVNPAKEMSSEVNALQFLLEDGRRQCSWRTDVRDPLLDYGMESFRNRVHELSEADAMKLEPELVRRCFLSASYFSWLRSGRSAFVPVPLGSDPAVSSAS